MSAALDFNTAPNLLSLHEQDRRNQFLNSKKLLEEKIAKAHAASYTTLDKPTKAAESFSFENKKEAVKPRTIRIKSKRVEFSPVVESKVEKAKAKTVSPLYSSAHVFSKAERSLDHHSRKPLNRHAISDEYRLAKTREKYRARYDKTTGNRMMTKYAASVLHKKDLPFGSGFAATFGSTPQHILTPSEKMNGPSSSDYMQKNGNFGTKAANFAPLIAWDDIRDADWATLGGMFDLRLQMESDAVIKARKQRNLERSKKLQGAAILQQRQEMVQTMAISERIDKKFGRTPRREKDKQSLMEFQYSNLDGSIRTVIGASRGKTDFTSPLLERSKSSLDIDRGRHIVNARSRLRSFVLHQDEDEDTQKLRYTAQAMASA
jgi:hypothetical protein